MRTKQLLAVATMASVVFGIGLVGCANNSQTTSTTSPSNATAGQRTYSNEDLNRTGKRTSADQLQSADPSVTTTH